MATLLTTNIGWGIRLPRLLSGCTIGKYADIPQWLTADYNVADFSVSMYNLGAILLRPQYRMGDANMLTKNTLSVGYSKKYAIWPLFVFIKLLFL